jgi:SPP1 family predicted phage head-tail adaptor
MAGYSTGMLNKRIEIYRRAENQEQKFGESGQHKYEKVGTFWAAESHIKGMKTLQEGAFDAYDKVMFRLRYTPCIDRWCLVLFRGRWYQILDFKDDPQDNTIQIIAQEMVNPPQIVETK